MRAEPHRLQGDALKATAALLAGYDLRSAAELRRDKPAWDSACQPIAHLPVYSGFRCIDPSCNHLTRNLKKIREHIASAYKKKAIEYRTARLWEACTLQSYFSALNLVDYFIIIGAVAAASGSNNSSGSSGSSSSGNQVQPVVEEEPFTLTVAE
jgi:hypothetical protein